MRSPFLLFLLLVACKSSSDKPAPAKDMSAPSPAPSAPASVPTPAAAPVTITGLGSAKPFEITLPAGYAHRIDVQDPTPKVVIEGGDLAFEIRVPDHPIDTLAWHEAHLLEGSDTTVEVATKDPHGYTLIAKISVGSGASSTLYFVMVMRVDLDLECDGAGQLGTRAQADRIVALCSTVKR